MICRGSRTPRGSQSGSVSFCSSPTGTTSGQCSSCSIRVGTQTQNQALSILLFPASTTLAGCNLPELPACRPLPGGPLKKLRERCNPRIRERPSSARLGCLERAVQHECRQLFKTRTNEQDAA